MAPPLPQSQTRKISTKYRKIYHSDRKFNSGCEFQPALWKKLLISYASKYSSRDTRYVYLITQMFSILDGYEEKEHDERLRMSSQYLSQGVSLELRFTEISLQTCLLSSNRKI